MTLTGAAWHQEELQLIHNCVPWVSVENSLLYSIFSPCRVLPQLLPLVRLLTIYVKLLWMFKLWGDYYCIN